MTNASKGFTLVAKMTAVLIVSILLGVALPSYRGYVTRANRADATIAMLRIASLQERFYLQNGRYANNDELTDKPPAGLGIVTGKSSHQYYNLSLEPAAGGLAIGFTATAAQDGAGKQATDTECTAFSIDQNGRRGANSGYVAATVEKCWK